MVTYNAEKLTATCSQMIGQFYGTMILAFRILIYFSELLFIFTVFVLI